MNPNEQLKKGQRTTDVAPYPITPLLLLPVYLKNNFFTFLNGMSGPLLPFWWICQKANKVDTFRSGWSG